MKSLTRTTVGTLTAVGVIVATLVGIQPATAAKKPAGTTLTTSSHPSSAPTVYTGTLSNSQLALLTQLGIDRHEDVLTATRPDGKLDVEVVMSAENAAALSRSGAVLTEKRVSGTLVRTLLANESARTTKVFRPWSGAGGLRAEFLAFAADHPDLVKVERVGRSVRGQEILAFKVTASARSTPDGTRPAVLYSAAQHALEWITPEMTRRLMRHVVEGYATDASLRRLLGSTELWFLPVANPDGYDYTFTEGNRLWRKNLRDNDGDDKITSADGVDPNRNFAQDWGYDDEGSSPWPSSTTYRGPRANSEPETVAFDTLLRKAKFAFALNYHSAAEWLLYGSGKQVATPEPDDTVFEALLGDRKNPAVPGFDPDRWSEMYTANGTADQHAHYRYGTLMVTPEMSTCQTASAMNPNDAFAPGDCPSVFHFPDSEPLIDAEFRKNLPLALATARSAATPDRPESVVGLVTPDFQPDTFSVSYGDPQTVAVTARRSLTALTARWRVNKGPARSAPLRQWRGGERYGQDGTNHYAEYRATVRGAKVGDSVTVWFTGQDRSATRQSKPFTYRLVADSTAPVLVLADEDITGVNPTYPTGTKGPKYARTYTAALKEAGFASTVYDIDRYGAPHPLGVLGHFRAVVWYLGDNRLTQDQQDTEATDGEPKRDIAVAERAANTTYAVRDYLNEGGKLVQTGETASYYGADPSAGGLRYGRDEDPSAPCVLDEKVDCRLLSSDFAQYYLGAENRLPIKGPKTVTAPGLLGSTVGRFGGPALTANPLDEAGAFAPTNSQLAARRPLFRSTAVGNYQGGGDGNPYGPFRGQWAMGLVHANSTYARASRTFDLTGVAATAKPTLQAQLSVDTEVGYDNVLVEARTPGQHDWTTLPDLGGATSQGLSKCLPDWLQQQHPSLTNYITGGEPCTPSGKTGTWNSITGQTGWVQTRFDLSAYAGRSVEISIAYVSDVVEGGAGALFDDVALLVNGTPRAGDSATFETDTDGWVSTPPAGGRPPEGRFARTNGVLAVGVRTQDTVLLGFGVEQLATRQEQAKILGSSLRSILP